MPTSKKSTTKKSKYPKKPKFSLGSINSLTKASAALKKIDDYKKRKKAIDDAQLKKEKERGELKQAVAKISKELGAL